VINAALMRRGAQKARPAISLTKLRARKKLPARSGFADDGPNPEQVFASTEDSRDDQREFWTNSRRCWNGVCAARSAGYSTGEAAKKLGVTENT